MPDATEAFAAKMNDPSQWVINRAVPVFEPHEAHFQAVTGDGGKVLRPARTVKVTESDLAEIVAEMAASEAAGQYGMITPGHLDPLKPATGQQEAFGYHRNPRLMKTGPDQKTRLVVDEYLYPDKAAERGKYPYRSADYFPSAKEIFGVAVLKQKPRLKLGTFAYSDQQRGECYQYAMPPMGGMPPTGNAFQDAQPGGGAAVLEADRLTPKITDEEKELADKFWEYFVEEFGAKLSKPKQDNPMESDPMATETVKPVAEPKPAEKGAEQYAAEVLQYKAELDTLKAADAARKAELEGIRLEREQERCEALMYQLEVDQYQLTAEEKDKEYKKLLGMPHGDRAGRVAELKAIYAGRKVPAGKVDLYQGHVEGGSANDPHNEPSYHQAALQYMRDNRGVQYDAAVDHVKKTASKQF